MKISYKARQEEVYKAVPAGFEGETKKFKMKSLKGMIRNSPNEPIVQSIAKRFCTQLGLEPIYSQSYGIDWAKFVGRSMTKELALDVEKEITEGLKISPFVDSVKVEAGAVDSDKLGVNVTVKIKQEFVRGRGEFGLTRTISL